MDDSWKSVIAAIESLKDQGNSAFAVGNITEAVEYYTEGLKLAQTLDNSKGRIVALLTNRTQALYKLHRYDEALDDARLSVQYDPYWFKVGLVKNLAFYAEQCLTVNDRSAVTVYVGLVN